MQDYSIRYDVLLFGFDSLYASFFIDGLGIDWEELTFRKEETLHNRQEYTVICLGGLDWALLPRGKFPFTYVLKRPHMTMSLSERMQPKCHVQFHSEALWTIGADQLLRDLRRCFVEIGTRETRPEKLSRVDWAFDVTCEAPDFLPEHVVSRTTKDATWRSNRALQTMQFGKGDTVLRMYDKAAEVRESSRKYWFYELWGQQNGVWRAEYQVRGPKLLAEGIQSFSDLKAGEGRILDQLTDKYASLRVPSGDSNRSRWPLHPLWQAVRNTVEDMIKNAPQPLHDRETPLAFALDCSYRSVLGMLKNLGTLHTLARGSKAPLSIPVVIELLQAEAVARLPQPLWDAEINERIEKRGYGL